MGIEDNPYKERDKRSAALNWWREHYQDHQDSKQRKEARIAEHKALVERKRIIRERYTAQRALWAKKAGTQ